MSECRTCSLRSEEIYTLENELAALKESHRRYRAVNEAHSVEMEKELADLNAQLLKMGTDFISRNTEYGELREKEAKWAEDHAEFQRFTDYHRKAWDQLKRNHHSLTLENDTHLRLAANATKDRNVAHSLLKGAKRILFRWVSHDPASRTQIVSQTAQLMDDIDKELLP